MNVRRFKKGDPRKCPECRDIWFWEVTWRKDPIKIKGRLLKRIKRVLPGLKGMFGLPEETCPICIKRKN